MVVLYNFWSFWWQRLIWESRDEFWLVSWRMRLLAMRTIDDWRIEMRFDDLTEPLMLHEVRFAWIRSYRMGSCFATGNPIMLHLNRSGRINIHMVCFRNGLGPLSLLIQLCHSTKQSVSHKSIKSTGKLFERINWLIWNVISCKMQTNTRNNHNRSRINIISLAIRHGLGVRPVESEKPSVLLFHHFLLHFRLVASIRYTHPFHRRIGFRFRLVLIDNIRLQSLLQTTLVLSSCSPFQIRISGRNRLLLE